MPKLILILGFALTLATLGSVRPVRAEPADTATVAAAFKQAMSAGDLDAATAQISDDIVLISQFGIVRGKAEFRAFFAGFIQQNPGFSVTYSESAIVLDTAVHRAFFTSDPIKAAGVRRIVEIDTMVVAQGKIVSLTGQLDLSDPETATFAAGLGGQ